MQIEGVSHATILTIISEIGPEGFKEFPTSKHFTSWMRLHPTIKRQEARSSAIKCLKEVIV
jgi:transposase